MHYLKKSPCPELLTQNFGGTHVSFTSFNGYDCDAYLLCGEVGVHLALADADGGAAWRAQLYVPACLHYEQARPA